MSLANNLNMLFSTRFNILKIVDQGTTPISVTGSTTADYLLATYSLGYIPRARVWYEAISGQLWPMSAEQFNKTGGGTGTPLPITGNFYFTSTGLFVRLNNTGSTATINVTWRIYADA